MRRLNSSIFQRSYHRLTQPTQVTVHNRLIGTWYPSASAPPDLRGPVPEETEEDKSFSKAQQAGRAK